MENLPFDGTTLNSKRQPRVLITVPGRGPGGVREYFNIIGKYLAFPHDFFQFTSGVRGRHLVSKVPQTIRASRQLSKTIRGGQAPVELVHINPSLNYGAAARDALFLLSAKKCQKKTLIFFHGWNETFRYIVSRYLRTIFYCAYRKADAFVVLGTEFKKQLREWGFKQQIFVETTPVDDDLLQRYSQKKRVETIGKRDTLKVLFLSRIEREKGILETLQAIKILSERYSNIKLLVAGEGSYLEKARTLVQMWDLNAKVEFLGFVRGEEKARTFATSDVYLFPTHGEGMPTSVLEAMAFGLPVLTRPVGGIRDFFEHGRHGFITESKEPRAFADFLERVLRNRSLWKQISDINHEYAKKHFLASKVARRLENIYRYVLGLRPVAGNKGPTWVQERNG